MAIADTGSNTPDDSGARREEPIDPTAPTRADAVGRADVDGGTGVDAPAILEQYRRGTPVAKIAEQLGVGFDHVARLVISARVRRVRPPTGRTRRRPPELDDDRWLSDHLARGAGVRTLSRLLEVRPSTVRGALRDHARRLVAATADADTPVSDPEQRFRVAAERAARARLQLGRARALQRSAVAELVGSGLTVAAVADRLDVDVGAVEALLGDPADISDATW